MTPLKFDLLQTIISKLDNSYPNDDKIISLRKSENHLFLCYAFRSSHKKSERDMIRTQRVGEMDVDYDLDL